MSLNLSHRPRRSRRTAAIRQMVRETRLSVNDLIYPLFVKAAPEMQAVQSMPGVNRHDCKSLVRECRAAAGLGIPAVALFPCIESAQKDATGSHSLADKNVLFQAVRAVKKACPDLMVMTDIALDPYTSHGHDGVLAPDGRSVANDETVELLCQLAVREAEAGADIVAPSDMMDGRVGAIRQALDEAGFAEVLILSYAAKYASAFYGPFREAVGSKIGKDAISKSTYQMDPANVREAIREIQLDEDEGADWLMVKPAGPYLDVIRAVREASLLPLAAYQVSGEYAQIQAAAQLGWLDYERTRDESLLAIKRAGADLIVTYFAREIAEALK
ncbi:MAG TPA: porphobilinogen synthase [Chthoniobacterales bacterium]